MTEADEALAPPPPGASHAYALAHHHEQLQWFAEEVMPVARRAAARVLPTPVSATGVLR